MVEKKAIFSPKQMVANYFASETRPQPTANSENVRVENRHKPEYHDIHLRNNHDAYVPSAEDFWSLRNRAIKYEHIDEWTARINDLNNQIKKIKSSTFLSEAEKQQKIVRRVDIIDFFKKKIADTENFLGLHGTINSKTR